MTAKEFHIKLHLLCEESRGAISITEMTAALEMEKFFWLQDTYTTSAIIARAFLSEAVKGAATSEKQTKS